MNTAWLVKGMRVLAIENSCPVLSSERFYYQEGDVGHIINDGDPMGPFIQWTEQANMEDDGRWWADPERLIPQYVDDQQTFDIVAKHMLTQLKKSRIIDAQGQPACMYRGPECTMCAAGVLIPDHLYDPFWNKMYVYGRGVGDLFKRMKCNMQLISHLQYIHDSTDVEDWKNELIKMTTPFYLNARIVDHF